MCTVADYRGLRRVWLILSLALSLLLSGVCFGDKLDLSRKVSVTLESMPLDAALNMLAGQYGLNMVVSAADATSVSLFLTDVTLEDALNALLYPNGFTYYTRGNVLVVTSGSQKGLGGMTTLYYRLKYAPASTAKSAVEPLLSPEGKVEALVYTDMDVTAPAVTPNAVMIHDFPSVVEAAQTLLSQIDVSEKMVMIEVKMVETKVDTKDILGFDWPTSVTARLRENGSVSNVTGGSGLTQQQASAGRIDLPDGKWDWGTLSVDELAVTLDYLQSTGKSKLISNPRLATLENHQAEFKVATVVPVQTINRFTEGAATSDIVSFQDIEVGITLQVTPRINDAGVVTMEVRPVVEEIIGFAGSTAEQKPITTERSVRTVVTCAVGETVVIGGLLRENEITNESKVFLLGDIPI
ncbi:MAG TPA: hypothetical protein VLB27_08415, partial [candidate division Zixibacteria bacterium]|nr:hypothetical protein [candidate division Zixibacteria bacterium]